MCVVCQTPLVISSNFAPADKDKEASKPVEKPEKTKQPKQPKVPFACPRWHGLCPGLTRFGPAGAEGAEGPSERPHGNAAVAGR